MGTLVVGLVVAAVVALAVYGIYRSKKNGGGCGCGCDSCNDCPKSGESKPQ